MCSAWYVFTIFVFFDCMQGVSNGSIQGLGLLKRVRWVSSFNYWVIGIPFSLLMMFHFDLGIEGLWYGPSLACALNYIMYSATIKTADWQQIAADTLERMKKEKAEMVADEDEDEKSK